MNRLFKTKLLCLILFLLLFMSHKPSYALPEYAEITGRTCAQCHINPDGGGALTSDGNAYKEKLKGNGLYVSMSRTQKVIRFFIGYIHIVTGIVWFGAIAYVHIMLKPAYAAKGLPRGELRLGWISIVIMAITGVLLTTARIPSTYVLLHTRFGQLLLFKIFIFLLMVATAVVVTFVIGPMLKKKHHIEHNDTGKIFHDFTLESLSDFDGKQGSRSYIAFKGSVYDVTLSKMWKEGNHVKRHIAGRDLTKAIEEAPHGEEKIINMPIVGTLKASKDKPQRPFYEQVFYFFAYSNLLLILLVLLVIALWRWSLW